MPQALEPLSAIHFWRIPFSHFLPSPLWGNKNWPPRIKVKKLENLGNKIGLTGCKWSSLNAPGTETPESHPFLENSLFSYSAFSGVIRIGLPSINGEKLVNFWNKMGLTGCKWSSLNAPGTGTPESHPFLENSLFSNSADIHIILSFTPSFASSGLPAAFSRSGRVRSPAALASALFHISPLVMYRTAFIFYTESNQLILLRNHAQITI